MGFGSVRADGTYEGLLITVGNFRITNRSTTRPVQVYFVLTIPYGDTRVAFDGRAHRTSFPPTLAINDVLPDTLAIAPAGSAHGTLRFFAPGSFDLDKLNSMAHYLQAFEVISDRKVNVTFTRKPPLDSVLSRPPHHTVIARESDAMD
ncbi:MAG: hypothetical protein SFU84_03295 [Gemmatimonadales bacterium]|nr:hypothetical protein [Gemmatimonadales bacterium]